MSATADITERIRVSLLDLERTLAHETAVEIARAVFLGACAAFYELNQEDVGSVEIQSLILRSIRAALPELADPLATKH